MVSATLVAAYGQPLCTHQTEVASMSKGAASTLRPQSLGKEDVSLGMIRIYNMISADLEMNRKGYIGDHCVKCFVLIGQALGTDYEPRQRCMCIA